LVLVDESGAPDSEQEPDAPKDPGAPASAEAAEAVEASAVVPVSGRAEDAQDAATADSKPELEAAGKPVEKKLEVVHARQDERLADQKKVKPAKSDPGGKRAPVSDDLIGDLFEKMHDLHFMTDVVSGAEFILTVVKKKLPCKVALVHVFDINSKNFVVVRQHGVNAKALLFQTPDKDPIVQRVMRKAGSSNLHGVATNREFSEGRWQQGGVTPNSVLVGPVKQGGRYLGLIELANPPGEPGFAEVEANALDYICEQFAEFLANRPIVLDADVILR
jgi:hypothetical protein